MPSPVSRGACISWLLALSSLLSASLQPEGALVWSLHLFSCLWPSGLPLKGPCDHTGATQVIQNILHMCAQSLSPVWFSATPRTVAHQAPLPMGLSRQEHWSRLPCPPPGDLPDPGIEPASPALAGRFFTTELPRKPYNKLTLVVKGSFYEPSWKSSFCESNVKLW